MPLPKSESPVYELTLPLSKIKINFRPFLVKEQRNLLMALESEDPVTIEQNVIQVLTNCTLTEGINVEKLPIIDVEYYFIQLRARSVGEISEVGYQCNNPINSEHICNHVTQIPIKLLDINVVIPDHIEDTFKLGPKLVVKLKYPEFQLIKRIKNSESITDFAFVMIAESIESIFDGEQYYYAKDVTPEEMLDFVETLTQAQFDMIQEFFINLPKMNKLIEYTCVNCNFEHKIEIEGLESFFG